MVRTSRRGTSYVEYFIVATAMALATVALFRAMHEGSGSTAADGFYSDAARQIAGP